MNEEKIKRYIFDPLVGWALVEEHPNNNIFPHVCKSSDVDILESEYWDLRERYARKIDECGRYKMQLPPDRWETVTEWEERTGKMYSAYDPVWICITEWELKQWWEHAYFMGCKVVVPRIGMGKPPEVING